MPGGPLSNGSYDLINYSGSLSGNAATLTLSGTTGGVSGQTFLLLTTAPSAGELLLQVAGGSRSLVWTGQQSGVWDTAALNWSNSGTAGTFSNGDAVTFDDTAGTAAVTLNTNVQPQSVFLNNNLLNYAFAGSGGISGSGSLTKSGSGALVVSLSNAYSGGTVINAGVFQAGNNSALGASTAALAVNGGTLDVHGYNLNVGPLTGTGTIDNLSGIGALTVGNGNASSTFSGTVQNTAGQLSLTKTGTGTLTLSGNVTLAGAATVSGGALDQSGGYLQAPRLVIDGGAYNLSGTGQVTAAIQYVGYSGSGAFNQTGGTNMIADALYLGTNAGSSGTYNLLGGLLVVTGIVQGSGSSSLNISSGSLTGLGGGVTFALPIVLTSSGSSGTFDTSSSSLTVAGPISGSGGLTKTGSGSLLLGALNSYSGLTNVNQGILLLANSAAVVNSTVAINVNNGLQFSPAVGTFNLGGLSGGDLLTLTDKADGAVALVVGSDGASTTFSGAIGGNGSLTKTGPGRLVLSGSDSYIGGTCVYAGTLVLASPTAPEDGTTLTVGAGGTFVFDPRASTRRR